MPDSPPGTPSPTIYIVDDDASVRTGLRRLLHCYGWTVRTFASAEDFLNDDHDGASGYLVIDVHLGRMSGLELQVRLSERRVSMPIIVTSGFDDASEVEALGLGATAFLRKPFEVEALLAAIESAGV